MQLRVQGKQIDVGDALRTHIGESIETVTQKYFDAIDATVVLSREAHLFHADVTVHAARQIVLQSTGRAADPYLAFDQAADKMAKRLRRHKRRLRDYDRGGAASLAPTQASYQVLEAYRDGDGEDEDEIGDAPVVIADMSMTVDSLTVSQAVMRLDLGDRPALLFRNSAHGGLNMVYRRVDGHIGWVDPKDGTTN